MQISEADEDVACIAAPIRDGAGGCPATISIVLPASRVREQQAALAEAVQSAALEAEAAMGWRTPGGDA